MPSGVRNSQRLSCRAARTIRASSDAALASRRGLGVGRRVSSAAVATDSSPRLRPAMSSIVSLVTLMARRPFGLRLRAGDASSSVITPAETSLASVRSRCPSSPVNVTVSMLQPYCGRADNGLATALGRTRWCEGQTTTPEAAAASRALCLSRAAPDRTASHGRESSTSARPRHGISKAMVALAHREVAPDRSAQHPVARTADSVLVAEDRSRRRGDLRMVNLERRTRNPAAPSTGT